jgi:hypothetical protein
MMKPLLKLIRGLSSTAICQHKKALLPFSRVTERVCIFQITLSSSIQTLTVGLGITPSQPHQKDKGRGLLPPVGNYTLP